MNLPDIFNVGQEVQQTYINELLDVSSENGLILTTEDARRIIYERNKSLKNCGRVELSIEVTSMLIRNFSTSYFIHKDDYVRTLIELQDIFYYLRNETEDRISDEKLIKFIRDLFENSCEGSIELLISKSEEFAREFRRGLIDNDCKE